MEYIINTEYYKKLRLCAFIPFILETNGKYVEAIQDHGEAARVLKEFLDEFKKKIGKFYRVMFERQREVHLERIKYLKDFEKKETWEGVVVPPSIVSAERDLNVEEGKGRPLSLDNKELFQAPKENDKIDPSKAPESIKHLIQGGPIPFFAPTLNASLPPTVYRIVHDSELIMLGQRSHWLYVKDATNTHTLYTLHCLWQDEVPITSCILRRASEFLPGAGAVQVSILRTPGGSFRLKMDTMSSIVNTETPDRGATTKHWSPRRFTYGGRNFVWKAEKDGGAFSKFEWETLTETSRTWEKEGSRTGKKEDEVVGERLCWGEKGGGKKVDHTIYMAAGLDQGFREHLLASQLTRFARTSWPANKDSGGVEAVGAGVGFLGLISVVAGS